MNDEQFQSFIDICFDELEIKQQKLIDTFGFGSFDKYELDLDAEEIEFLQADKVCVRSTIVPIGSFNSLSKTWMWGWANKAYPESLRLKSAKLKELVKITGFDIFGNEITEIDEDMIWEIASMALNHLKLQGVYRSPASNTQYFYAINGIHRVD
ncbi:hypothetical protein L4C34_02280 [Vibrio profundum]|uniref:DUF6882 domain-containing protein n=1 Tax=Vibrio profundum TaxID=2910247 RepID=UPI003D111A25